MLKIKSAYQNLLFHDTFLHFSLKLPFMIWSLLVRNWSLDKLLMLSSDSNQGLTYPSSMLSCLDNNSSLAKANIMIKQVTTFNSFNLYSSGWFTTQKQSQIIRWIVMIQIMLQFLLWQNRLYMFGKTLPGSLQTAQIYTNC